MKKQIIFVSSIALSLMGSLLALPQEAQAGRVEPESVKCWFYKGNSIALKNTCTYESHSWTGGWTAQLTWEDGIRNTIAYGTQGRGYACSNNEQYAIDETCGEVYYRNPRNLRRISESTAQRLRNNQSIITCVQLTQKSVCWQR